MSSLIQIIPFPLTRGLSPKWLLSIGLFRHEETVDGVKYVDGWIFLPDGDVRGARTGGGKITKATWIDPDVDPWINPDIDP